MRKHSYPKNRKPPVKHSVSKHDRAGKLVSSYERGSGKKKAVPRKPRGKPTTAKSGSTGNYIVELGWPNDRQAVSMKSSNFYNAAITGIESRKRAEIPDSLIVRLIK